VDAVRRKKTKIRRERSQRVDCGNASSEGKKTRISASSISAFLQRRKKGERGALASQRIALRPGEREACLTANVFGSLRCPKGEGGKKKERKGLEDLGGGNHLYRGIKKEQYGGHISRSTRERGEKKTTLSGGRGKTTIHRGGKGGEGTTRGCSTTIRKEKEKARMPLKSPINAERKKAR